MVVVVGARARGRAHGKCLQVFMKEQGKGAKGASPFHSYTDAKREAAPTAVAGSVNTAPAGSVSGAAPKFCGNCGAARALGDKFCAKCGTGSQ